jgi:hypothetical protein
MISTYYKNKQFIIYTLILELDPLWIISHLILEHTSAPHTPLLFYMALIAPITLNSRFSVYTKILFIPQFAIEYPKYSISKVHVLVLEQMGSMSHFLL